MKIYMAVTADKYELPIAVEADYKILAKTFGIRPDCLLRAISRGEKGKRNGYKFLRIEVS